MIWRVKVDRFYYTVDLKSKTVSPTFSESVRSKLITYFHRLFNAK